MRFSAFILGALTAALVSAHPGDDASTKEKERLARRTFLDNVEKRDVSHCAAKLKARGVEARNVQRRAERASALRRELGIPELHRMPPFLLYLFLYIFLLWFINILI